VLIQRVGRAWLVPGAAFALALVLRVIDLGRVTGLVFDEAYYVPQAWSVLNYGIERKFAKDGQSAFVSGDLAAAFTSGGDFPVHPPLGKWLIALGETAGATQPWTWRISAAVAGALIAALVAAMAIKLTGSAWWGAFAGALLAVEGTSLVEGRTGILDTFLTLFVVAGAAAALMDRDDLRPGRFRRWRLAAAVCLGLATGVKFSGAVFLALYLLLAIAWDVRRSPHSLLRSLGAAARAVATITIPAVAAYTVSWAGWFLSPDGHGRDGSGNILANWIRNQLDMLSLGGAISSPHHWQSGPWAWLIQWRPTMFYVVTAPCEGTTGTCSQTITSLGTVPIWWIGIVALVGLGWLLARHGDRDAAFVLAFFAGGYAPWWLLTNRTIYAFYTVTIAPFVILALVVCLYRLQRSRAHRRVLAQPAALLILAAAIAWLWLYWPVYTGIPIPQGDSARLLFWEGWQ
jgi:dolichyl-phosphate-mannose--protein O-mannosyl transferase